MNINTQETKVQRDQPLTRTDIERILHDIGSSNKLTLQRENMANIDLKGFRLSGADLSGANLSGADLTLANLSGANLSGANLSGANLSGVDLSGANLSGANLSGANLSEVYLCGVFSGADLSGADLSGANLSGADLSEANLSDTNLSGVDLSRVNLSGVDLSRVNLSSTNLSGADLIDSDFTDAIKPLFQQQFLGSGARDLDNPHEKAESTTSTLRITIIEEPLTPYNLAAILSALTELYTKLWLISKGRFADLIEYTQTHDTRFAVEAGLIITKVTYNSPFNMDWKVDLTATGVADALVTAIDGIGQRKERLAKAMLEVQETAQQIEQAKQKADNENQMAVLERKERELEIKERQLILLERELEIQKKGIEYALEIAKMMVNQLYPNANDSEKSMIMQSLLSNILQIQNNKAMVLALPVPQNDPGQSAKPDNEKKP